MVVEGDELELWTSSSAAGDGGGGGGMERILVSVRLRPLSDKELARGETCDWECIDDTTIIFRSAIPGRPLAPTAYSFDRVFHGECSTRQVYHEAAKEVALSVVSGINATIFAYGQTSSGKTYTMMGVIELAMTDIFDYMKRHEERAFVMKFSGIEIYNEAVKDLLCPESGPLRLLDDPERGVIVERLTEETVRDWTKLEQLLSICEAQRQIGETLLNEASSRSHQIIKLTIESSAREFIGKDKSSTLVASVNFVDLAGSERASQALSAGARLKEGCHINRSLLSLGTVIRKLSNGRHGHIPYRDSKLTRILQPALGGNARTAIICTLCPGESHIEQSRNTLLFASCAKEVVTNAQVNVVMSDKALVKQLQKEVARLESELKRPEPASNTCRLEALLRQKDDQIKKMEKEMKELIKQRDLAESQLQDMRQAAREHEDSSHITSAEYDSTLSTSATPRVGYQGLGLGLRKSLGSVGSNECHPQLSDKRNQYDVSHSISGQQTSDGITNQTQENGSHASLEDFDDTCKEVQCIVMDETPMTRRRDRSPSLGAEHEHTSAAEDSMEQSVDGPLHDDTADSRSRPDSSVITQEHRLSNTRRKFNDLGRTPDESSLMSTMRYFPSSGGFSSCRSRSCRAVLMDDFTASPWFCRSDITDGTTPGLVVDFSGRHKALNYSTEAERMSAMKEMARKQYDNRFISNQETKGNINGGNSESATDVGLDPMFDISATSPSRWPVEFKQKRQEIIELWETCLVPMVHRTYFFLLFDGDPADSIYIEVELRRLSYLRKSLFRNGGGEPPAKDGQDITIASSTRNLRREKLMLCRQIHKKMAMGERKVMYQRWGIPLDSKQRKMQLVRRLWTKTKDSEHVMDSALLVAKLVGLMEPGKAPKEMFGLSIAPPQVPGGGGRMASFMSMVHGMT